MEKVFEYFDEIVVREIASNKTFKGEYRIDPGYYSSSENIIHEIDTKPLIEFCEDIFNPPVFKREFQESSDGCRYLASAEIISLNPEVTFISNSQADNLNLRIKKGWILVTGFGTIGSIRIVDNVINNYAVANNVARIIPKETFVGFLAAYLESPIGNQLLNNYAAGAVVKYIEAPQISKIPVPVFEPNVVESINERYLNAVTLREEATHLLQEANGLVSEYNSLPALNTEDADFFDPQKLIQTRKLNSSSILGEYRLDAHFYNPIADLAASNIRAFSNGHKQISEITSNIFYLNRFSRTFVKKEYGIPYLAGKDITKIRPNEMSYLSKQETEGLSNYFLEKGWILLTCSGTIGRTCFIWENYEKFVATHDIIRIVPNSSIDAGYLSAFLSSDYGYHQIMRYKHGAVIDHITPDQVALVVVPIPSNEKNQEIIGDKVRLAYEKRAEAIRLEDEAQDILKQTLTQ